MVTIDKLASDLLSSTRVLAAPIFPDAFVEGVLFFKRAGVYYIIYSSCCCCWYATRVALSYYNTVISLIAATISLFREMNEILSLCLSCVRYLLVWHSSCCDSTAGAGAVVYRATAISGPWLQQPRDVNCNAISPICAGMPSPYPKRPTGHLIIPAQGFNIARLRGPGGGPGDLNATYVWTGERWLSGPYAPSHKCVGDCAPATGVCTRDPRFRKGHEFT